MCGRRRKPRVIAHSLRRSSKTPGSGRVVGPSLPYPAAVRLSAGSHPPRHNQTVRLLVVEDDARMAAALRRGLRYEGIVADVAGLGAQAVGMARATDYDAIVLDVMLPDIDGFETCRRLRARSE